MIEPLPSSIKDKLQSHERVLWWGRPKRGFLLQGGYWVVAPIGLLFSAIAGSAVVAMAHNGISIPGILVVLFGGAAGLYMMPGLLFRDAKRRACTFYALTPTRILIVAPKPAEILLTELSEMTVEPSWDGRGSIILGPRAPCSAKMALSSTSSRASRPSSASSMLTRFVA